MSEIMRADYTARLNVQLGKLSAEDLAYLDGWNIGSVVWLLREYEAERLMRDCDCETKVLLACEERDQLIRELLERRCRQSCADCEHEEDEGCEFMRRAVEMGIEVYKCR